MALRLNLVLLAALVACAGCMGLAQRGGLLQAQEARNRGDFERAIELANQTLAFQPPDPEIEAQAVFIKAESLEALGNKVEAAQLYRYLATVLSGTRESYQAVGRLEQLQQDGVSISSGATGPGESFSNIGGVLVVDRPWLAGPVEVFYPVRAEIEGLEGFVVIRVVSDSTGGLESFEIVQSTHPLFEQAARAAIPQFKFVVSEMQALDPPFTKTFALEFRK